MIKWIFFDVGSTLVDETEAYDHRVREMIAGTNITFQEFDDVELPLPSRGWMATPPQSSTLDWRKLRGTQKMKFHARMHIAHCLLSLLRDISSALSQIQKPGTAERLESWGLRQYFDVIAASAELGFSKPDQRNLWKGFWACRMYRRKKCYGWRSSW